MTDTAENPQPDKNKQPKEGIRNHPLDEEQHRQAKVLPFRERTDKKESDRKTK